MWFECNYYYQPKQIINNDVWFSFFYLLLFTDYDGWIVVISLFFFIFTICCCCFFCWIKRISTRYYRCLFVFHQIYLSSLKRSSNDVKWIMMIFGKSQMNLISGYIFEMKSKRENIYSNLRIIISVCVCGYFRKLFFPGKAKNLNIKIYKARVVLFR